MGVSIIGCSTNRKASAPNPSPSRFRILKTQPVGNALVAKIKYQDCTNYEGVKVIGYEEMSVRQLHPALQIDPHFSESVNSPFARFKPTEDGWNAALELAARL